MIVHQSDGLDVRVNNGGIGTATFHPQAATMVVQASGQRHGLAMSIFVTGGHIGYALGPVIILAIIRFWGLSYSFLTIIPGLIITLLLFLYAPEVKPITKPQPKAVGRPSEATSQLSLKQIIYTTFLTIMALSRAIVIVGLGNFSPLYLTQQQFSMELAGLSVSIFLIIGGIGTFLGGTLSDKIGRKRLIFWSFILAIPFMTGYIAAIGMVKLLFLAIAGFFLSLSLPVTIVMAQELIPSHSGTVSSLLMGFCWGIAGFSLTPMGYISEAFGIPTVLWGLCFLPLVALVFLLPIPATMNRSKLQPSPEIVGEKN